tara:strand:+ start:1068 stop:2126 length:1059 start_codon:yes stop_codon:yes gene_type:complete
MIARMHAVGANAFRINMSHTSKDDLAERVAAIRDVESRSGRPIRISAMTEKDRCDLEAAVGTGVDWIALSFVQRSEDIAEVREAMQGRALVMAKIEKPQAVARLEEIIHASDALMVARGDLGVEMPLEKMPSIQKLIIRSARRRGKPVVVATQMLESMIASPVPTRAEVSNVATAVFEGADAIMLSAESATGKYPAEAVATMSRIAEEIECDNDYRTIVNGQRAQPVATGADAIAVAARSIAETIDPGAIVAWTASGATGLHIARERPHTPLIALTPNVGAARHLALVSGVHSIVTDDASELKTWQTVPAESAALGALSRRETPSSSSPVCPSVHRERPIWFGLLAHENRTF